MWSRIASLISPVNCHGCGTAIFSRRNFPAARGPKTIRCRCAAVIFIENDRSFHVRPRQTSRRCLGNQNRPENRRRRNRSIPAALERGADTKLPVVVADKARRILTLMRWGLVPSWAKDLKIGYSTFNARAETLVSRAAFRGAWQAGRRCLVIADGYYEWRDADKQPFAVALANRGPMTLAGFWES